MNNMSDSGWSNQVVQAFLVEIITGQPGSGLFVYNGNPALGNPPITSITGGTTDPEGNVVEPTIELQGTGSLWVRGPGGQQVRLAVIGSSNNVPYIGFLTGASEESQAANIQGVITNPGVSEVLSMIIVGPQITGTDPDSVFIVLNSPAKDASFRSGGNLVWNNGIGTEFPLVQWGASGVRVATTISGDTNSYQADEMRSVQSANLTVNTTGFTQQFLSSFALGVATYILEGQVRIQTGAAAGQPQFMFLTAGAVATMQVDFDETIAGAPATIGAMGAISGFGVNYNGVAMTGAGSFRNYRFKGTLTVTTAGTFGIFAATTVAADTYTIQQGGTYLLLKPFNA